MTHKIAAVPGDGINEEVVPEHVRVLVDNRIPGAIESR